MNMQDFIKPELFVLVPVMYLVGLALKKSKLADKWIPFILGGIGVILSGIWVFANSEVSGMAGVLQAIFTAFVQGVLVAGVSVYADQLVKQAKKEE